MTPDPAVSMIQAIFIQACLFWLGMLGWVVVLWTFQTIRGAWRVWNGQSVQSALSDIDPTHRQ